MVFYNPLSLEYSKQDWHLSDSALGKIKVVAWAPAEIFVYNPIRLTLGNVFALKNSSQSLSKWQKVGACAAIVFGTLYSMMLIGSCVMLLGKGIALLGTATGLNPVSIAGEAVKNIGLKTFVVGGVPFYALFYELPKHIYHAAPGVWHTVSEKVAIAAEWILENILAPIWDKVIAPAANEIDKAYQLVADELSVVLKPVTEAISSAADWVFHQLTPVFNVIGKGCSYVANAVGPALKSGADAIVRAVSFVFNKVIVPAGKMIAHAVVEIGSFLKLHVFDKAIAPAVHEVRHGFIALSNGISKLVYAS